ncbi:hypothetical protein ABW19_dt0206010 [Dactylella cylindrospora]|nr:hypothetical protein ABW19_dt0206010 [Dactylella cylindrospora]
MLHYVLISLVVWLGYSIWSRLDLYFRERKFRKLHGTERPTKKPQNLPFGLDILYVVLSNFKKQQLPEFIRSEFELYGNTYALSLLGTTSISTREPRNVQALLATQFKEFGLGPSRYGVFKPLLGDGIFTLDGHGWEHSRGLLRPQFSRDQITQLENMEQHVQTMMDCIPGDGSVTDLQELFFELTIDTATQFLFGESCDALAHRRRTLRGEINEAPVGIKFAFAFNLAQEHLVNRYRLRKFYNWHNPQDFKDANRICHDFVDKYVHRAIHIGKMGINHSEKEGKKQYIFLEEIAKETQDPKILRDSLLNILLAGRDTTAGLLAFTFYLLVRYPEVEQKLRATIKDSFGEEGDQKLLTFEGLKNCIYLRWVVNEVLRLYPSVPFNTRTAIKDTILPVGGGPDQLSPVFVPKGTNVEYSVYAMHRREDIWGPDANWFRPERWGEPRKKGFNNFEYLPFNGGPRICLGQQYALTEASYAIVRMFQRFKRFENGELNPFLKCNATLTMCVGGKGTLVKCYKD